MLRLVIAGLALVAAPRHAAAGPHWSRTYADGASNDIVQALVPTPGGGATALMMTFNAGPGHYSYWLLEIDDEGNPLWQGVTGTPEQDNLDGACLLDDGRIAVVGSHDSIDTGLALVFEPGTGLSWSRSLLTAPRSVMGNERIAGVAPAPGGGLIVVGHSSHMTNGIDQAIVRELSATGDLVGGFMPAVDNLTAVTPAPGGGWIAVGVRNNDGVVMRLAPDLTVTRTTVVPSSVNSWTFAVAARPDGGCAVAGYQVATGGRADAWLFGMSSTGLIEWQYRFANPDSTAFDYMGGVAVAADGSTIACGHSRDDSFVVKISPSGTLEWQQMLGGGSGTDHVLTMTLLEDGDILLGGQARSWGNSPAWIVRLGPDGTLCPGCTLLRPGNLVVTPLAGTGGTTTPTRREIPGTATDAAWILEPTACTVATQCGATATGLPGEVSGPGATTPLLFVDPTTITWETVACDVDAYNAYRGDVRDLRAGLPATCLAGHLALATTTDAALPGVGVAWYYVVTGENTFGEGPAGSSSLGVPRVVTSCL